MYSKKFILSLLTINIMGVCTMTYGMKRKLPDGQGLQGCDMPVARVARQEGSVPAAPSFYSMPLTPLAKGSARRLPMVSPQKVHVDTPNVVRGILAALGDQQDVSTAVRNALQCFVEWKRSFPMYFERINWYCKRKQSGVDEFKYRLKSALDYVLLVCVAGGCGLSQNCVRINNNDTYGNLSSLKLGPFEIVLQHAKGKGAKYAVRHSTDHASDRVPSYKEENVIKQLVTRDIFSGRVEVLQGGLQAIFSSVPEFLRVGKEQFYHALLYGMISFMGSNFSQIEVCTGDGRADMVVQHDQLGRCIIEFKFNQSAQTALNQIEQRDYSRYFRSGKVVCIGINVNHNPLTVTCASKMLQIKESEISVGANSGLTEASFQEAD